MTQQAAPAVFWTVSIAAIALFVSALGAEAASVGAPSGVSLPPGAVEIVDVRTLHSKTFLLPDGQYATRISLSPLHYEDATGAWQDIDTTLQPSVGGFVNTKNTISTRLGLDGSVTVSRAGASATWTPEALVLRDAGGAAIAQTPAKTPLASVSGSTLALSNLFEGATDVHRVGRSLLKNDLVLARAPFAPSASAEVLAEEGFVTLSPGISVVVDGEHVAGSFSTTSPVEFLLPDGTLAFRLSGVFVHDARFPAPRLDSEDTPTYATGSLRGTLTPNGLRLAVEVPAAWLYAPERVYPVTIDPTWGWDDVESSIYIRQTEGNKNADNFLKVGEEQGDFVFCCHYEDDYNRAFLRQDLGPLDNKITSISEVRADVNMYQWYSVAGTFNSYFVSSDSWSPATLTPSNQPAVSTFLGSVSISSGGWKTTLVDTSVVSGQLNADHMTLFNGDDQFSYSMRRSPETSNTDSAMWFHRTGSSAPEWLVTYVTDTTAPATNYGLSGTLGDNGWYRSTVSASLSCSDTGSGCYTTQYRLNGGGWSTYGGTFSITPQGTTTLDYQSMDYVQNWNSVGSASIKIDSIVPTTGSTVTGTLGNNGWYVSAPSVTLSCTDATSGCAESQWRINGAGWNTYTGAFSVSTPGINTVDRQSRDAAGNWNTASSQSIKVDNVLPSISHTATGTLGGNGWFRTTPSVSLSVSDVHSGIAATEYRLNGGAWQTYTGAFNVGVQGTNTLDYRATDMAGNVNTVTGVQIKVDLTAPSVSSALDGVAGLAGWFVSQVGVTLTGTDAHSGVSSMEYRLDGGSWTAYTTQFTLTTNGQRNVEYRGTDVAGNLGSIQATTPKIDTVLPTSSLGLSGTLGLNGWYVSPVAMTLTGSDATSGVGELRYRVNGGAWQPYSNSVNLASQGATSVEHQAIDAAGNAELVKSTNVKIDTVLPATTRFLSGTVGGNGWYTTPVDVTLTASDATSGVLRTDYRVNGGAWETYTQPFQVSGEGVNVVEYRSVDSAGNMESAISVTLMIDTVVPTVTALLDGLLGQLGWYLSNVEVTLTGTDGASGIDRVYYRIGGSGDWTLYSTPFELSNDGTTTFSAYAVDQAGNVGQTASWSVDIDQTVPITSRTLTGTLGAAGWFRSNVEAALSCVDTPSGCDDTFVAIGSGAFEVYAGPVALTTEGVSDLHAYSTDVAGNTEPTGTGQVKIDKTAPLSTASLSPLPNALGWIREAGTVTIESSDALSGVASIENRLDGGSWAAGSTRTVAADGIHTVGYRASDVAGNVEAESTMTVRLDTIAPTTTATLTPVPNAHGWNAGDVLVSLAATDALSGVDAIFARVDGGAWTQTNEVTVAGDLAHVVEFYATDLAGNAETVKAVDVRIDTTPPLVSGTLAGLLGNAEWYLGNVELTLSATDALSGVDQIRVSVDGAAEGAYTTPVNVAADGLHTSDFRAIDKAGVSSGTSSRSFKIDATPPVTTSALDGLLGGGGWFLGDVTVSLAATDAMSGVAGTSYAVDGASRVSYGAPFVVTSDGIHSVAHGSTDVAGNTETDGTTTVKIDTGAPVLAATLLGSLGNQNWYVGPVNVRIDATDAQSGVASIEVRVDGGAWQPYSGPVPVTGSGTHNVEFRGADVAGNPSILGTTTFRIDVDLPVTSHTLTGTLGELGWYRSAVDLVLATTDATSGVATIRYQLNGGAWHVYADAVPIVPDGEHTIRYFAEDVAGNAEAARTITVRIDGTVPATVRTLTGLLGLQGWYVGPVSVELAASDAMSGISRIMTRVNGGEWTQYTGSIALSTDGTHGVQYQAFDNAGNAEPVRDVTVRIDKLAPASLVTLTGPLGQGGWFTGDVSAALSATDITSGVASIEWSLDNGAWQAYASPVAIVGDGAHTLRWRAIDVAGNVEAIQSVGIQIDATLPTVTLSILGPLLEDVLTFVTSATQFSLSASDVGSGVNDVVYRIDGAAWQTYTAPFSLALADGTHTIEYYALDAAGNAGPTLVKEAVVDNTGPLTTLTLTGPQIVVDLLTVVSGATQFTMSAADGALGSGVAEIRYAVNGGADRAYLPFKLEGADGERTIAYWAVDRLGNAAPAASFAAVLDTTAPIPALALEGPTATIGGDVYVALGTTFALSANDPGPQGTVVSGVASVEYRIDDGAWRSFTDPFSLAASADPVSVTYRATDAVGNVATAVVKEFLVDSVAPDLSIIDPRPGSITAQDWYFTTDSDSDGFADVLEIALGSDPNDPTSWPDPRALLPVPTNAVADVEDDALEALAEAQRRAYAFEGSVVLFDLSATDAEIPASGVAELRVSVNGELVAVITEAPYEWGFDTTGLALGIYAVTIEAVDAVDNAFAVTMEVHVLPASLETAAQTATEVLTALEGLAVIARDERDADGS